MTAFQPMKGPETMAVKRPGPYAPLSAYYADDDRIMAAGEAAELLFVRLVSYCARVPALEGFVTDTQMATRLGLRNAAKRAETLVQVGLLIREDGGYRVRAWTKWNRTQDEIDDIRRKDATRKTGNTSGKRSGNTSGTGGGNRNGNAPDSRDNDQITTDQITTDHHPRGPETPPEPAAEHTGRQPDDDDRPKIDHHDLAQRLGTVLGPIDATWAERIAREILAAATSQIADPQAYVLRAVRNEPQRYKPPDPGPPPVPPVDRSRLAAPETAAAAISNIRADLEQRHGR